MQGATYPSCQLMQGCGKLLVLGAALGCLSTCLTVAACLSYRTPFASSQDQQDAAGRTRQAMAATGHSLHPVIPFRISHALSKLFVFLAESHTAWPLSQGFDYKQCSF